MNDVSRGSRMGQVAGPGSSPAEVYDARFVPALFRRWGPVVTEAARAARGQRVLDVGCGTGALAEALCARVGPAGEVVGLDPNPQMLEVARRKNLPVDWREGRAEALPFGDRSFDAVGCQFAMMFFEDRPGAMREIARVLRPDGHFAVAVCDAIERSPGYASLAALLERLFGDAVAQAFRAPFALGDSALLRSICDEAGLTGVDVSRHSGVVRFDSVAELISTERACAWTLGGLLDDAQFDRLLEEANTELRPFVEGDGKVAFEMPVLMVTDGRR